MTRYNIFKMLAARTLPIHSFAFVTPSSEKNFVFAENDDKTTAVGHMAVRYVELQKTLAFCGFKIFTILDVINSYNSNLLMLDITVEELFH